jgi:hypothetical protein
MIPRYIESSDMVVQCKGEIADKTAGVMVVAL